MYVNFILDGVRSISLSSEEVKESVTVTISGWGKTRANDSSISPLLNYVNLVTISNEECQKAYGDSGLILPEMVCAATNPAPVQTPCNVSTESEFLSRDCVMVVLGGQWWSSCGRF